MKYAMPFSELSSMAKALCWRLVITASRSSGERRAFARRISRSLDWKSGFIGHTSGISRENTPVGQK
jgi:hypothetical protein